MLYDLFRLASAPAPRPGIPHSPTAVTLSKDVSRLATNGTRNVAHLRALELSAEYIIEQFKQAGYVPANQDYEVPGEGGPIRVRNIVATLPGQKPNAPVLIVGAHYDSALLAPGADDNATGVAAMLELARRLRAKSGNVEIRFVAFSTEEPPFFGTAHMGSHEFVRRLRDEHRDVAGMICLEMLGYYNSEKDSQKYPPGLSFFFPHRGDFIGAVSNLGSRPLLKKVISSLHPPKGTPVVSAALPGVFSSIKLSDQLWFWSAGYQAVMISDTAYYRNPNYHQLSDTPEKLDFEKMADVVDGLEGVVAALSR